MIPIEDVLNSIPRIVHCQNEREIFELMDEIFVSIGVKNYNYSPIFTDNVCITYHNYPQDWTQRYITHEYGDIDPTVITAKGINSVKEWNDCCTFAGEFLKYDKEQKSKIKHMKTNVQKAGLNNGLGIPIVSHCYKQHGFYLAFLPSIKIDETFTNAVTALCFVLHNQFYSIISKNEKSVNIKHFEKKYPESVPFTKRERQIISLYCNGKTREDCGLLLGVAVSTIDTLTKRMFLRTRVNSQLQLLVIVQVRGWWRVL